MVKANMSPRNVIKKKEAKSKLKKHGNITVMPEKDKNEIEIKEVKENGEEDDYPESYTESEKMAHSRQWSKSNIEDLLKSWGEKAGGLRWMHSHSAAFWRHRDNTLNYIGITLSTVISASSLTGPTEIFIDPNYVMLFVGIIGMINMLVQSLQRFYRSSEQAARHENAARQFGYFNRYIATKLSMSRKERGPPKQLLNYALNENDRLHKENPDPHHLSMCAFREHFGTRANNLEFSIPDFVTDTFKMSTYDEEEGVMSISRPFDQIHEYPPQPIPKRRLKGFASMFKSQTNHTVNPDHNLDSSTIIIKNDCDPYSAN